MNCCEKKSKRCCENVCIKIFLYVYSKKRRELGIILCGRGVEKGKSEQRDGKSEIKPKTR